MHITVQFKAAIANAGISPPHEIVGDGRLHRFATSNRRGDKAGWYILHLDGVPNGRFGCWRSGKAHSWRASVSRAISSEERRRYTAQRQSRQENEAHLYRVAGDTARYLWREARPAKATHPYLVQKRVRPHELRELHGELLVPLYDGHRTMWSVQLINSAGHKRMLAGGRVRGCYHPVGAPTPILCIAEGWATAASIHEATGYAVVVAMSAGNVSCVAEGLRRKCPGVELLLCADNDPVGIEAAHKAAQAAQGRVATPPEPFNDFNDLAAQRGLAAVRRCFEPPTTAPNINRRGGAPTPIHDTERMSQ